jgi:DsbC/DsbD-like thiol-disulfide interchange protein
LRIPLTALTLVLMTAIAGHAQIRRPKADVTPLLQGSAVHAGGPVRLALRVSLPEGLHTQSNTPRDPTLIPTVLTIDAPAGVVVDEIVFPPSTDLKQAGLDQLLAVFEHEFAIGVQLTLDRTVAPGDLIVPGHLRYQACDANLCYAPSTADVQWTIPVVPAATALSGAHDPVFDGIAFGSGQKPAAATAAAPAPVAGGESGIAQLENFTVLATTGGYIGRYYFHTFIHNA